VNPTPHTQPLTAMNSVASAAVSAPPRAGRGRARWLPALLLAALLTTALAGFVWVARPVRLQSVEPALNYVPVTAQLGTAGMPRRAQFARLAGAGYQVVINLAPDGVTGAHADEARLAAAAGLAYHHVPVEFAQPTAAQYAAVAALLRRHRGERVLVHCQVNMRASVMVFLYRTIELGEDVDRAYDDVLRIWQPSHAWRRLIRDTLAAAGKPLPMMLD
jgi:uncharacterized protein (TIGR01244 family)